ncbi:hypothetical protein UlMin_022922 [Ulmus minor]
MGNCVITSNNKVLAEENGDDPKQEPSREEEPSTLKGSNGGNKKKTVRFKLKDQDEEISGGRDSKSRVVRIKLVVTQEELKQLLDHKDGSRHTGVEELLNVVKLRGRRVLEVNQSGFGSEIFNGSWRPALESIPEDH